jgi:hypothetical protein
MLKVVASISVCAGVEVADMGLFDEAADNALIKAIGKKRAKRDSAPDR